MLNPKLPQVAALRHPTTGKPIMVKQGQIGYWPLDELFDIEEFNHAERITSFQLKAMEIGSLFGWDVPGADPDYWKGKTG